MMRLITLTTVWLSMMAGAILGLGTASAAAAGAFYLRPHDRVVFYGDSITEQRYYPVAVQTFVRTRFPDLKVRFVDSGVGGDTVRGGWAGPIDQRLKRDVLPFHPTVVTIMLGMNDGGYRPFNAVVLQRYLQGYVHIIQWLRAHLPGVRLVLIEPSPFDDYSGPVRRRGLGTYNQMLIRMGRAVAQLAARYHALCVNFNAPLVKVIQQVRRINPALAPRIIPKRVHPGATAQMVMAQLLLQAWNAPALVSSVEIRAGSAPTVTRAVNTRVGDLTFARGALSWTQTDRDLPYPMMTLHARHAPQFPPVLWWNRKTHKPGNWPGPTQNLSYTNPLAALVLHLTHAYQVLDQQRLRVSGLPAGNYELQINAQSIGRFTAAKLAAGINLARYNTPMMARARHVMTLVWQQTQYRFRAWRRHQLPALGFGYKAKRAAPAALARALAIARVMYRQCRRMDAAQYAAAQPRPDRYRLTRIATP